LVAAERAFSATSVEKGMRDAFLTFLADDGVIFRPLPVNGKKIWEARQPVPATLIWEPSYAEVSAAGDLGYTTGPWEYRPPADKPEAQTAYGHFISVWRKQADGAWRVAVDIGGQHEKPERGVGSGDLTLHPAPSAQGARPRGKSPDLAELDRRLSQAMSARGAAAGFAALAAADVRLNRDGSMPRLGVESTRAALDTIARAPRFSTRGSGLSASLDLGYTYGMSLWSRRGGAAAHADSGVYLHVWRRGADQRWKLALAVENPL
jgi:ketosteroid isomerase-like protein